MKADAKSMMYLSTVNQFEIPYFQRAYVWTEENWEQIVEDWKYGENISNYLGSIIINNPYTSTDDNYHNVEVIDGQQRLTTLTIMYKALYDVLISNTHNDIEKGKYIGNKEKILGKNNLKIIHSEYDYKYYNDVMNGNIGVGEILLSSEMEGFNKGKKNNHKSKDYPRIYQCYRFFYKYFTYNIDKAKGMWVDLNSSNKMLFVVIDIDETEDAQQIFDCTNSAGVKLTIADLVKNELFRKMKCFYIKNDELESIYEKTWRKIFELDDLHKKFWEADKSIGRIKRNNHELLLYCVLVIMGKYDPRDNKISELYSIYKNLIAKSNKIELDKILYMIFDYATIYFENFNTEWDSIGVDYSNKICLIDLVMKNLGSGVTTFYPYIMKLIYEKDLNINIKLSRLIMLMLRVAICSDSNTLKDYTVLNYNLVKDSNKSIDVYYNEIYKKGKINDDYVKVGLRDLQGKNNLAKLLLFLLELKSKYDNNLYDFNAKQLKYCYSLEHIMPQKYEKYWNFYRVPQMVLQEKTNKWISDCSSSDEQKDVKRREAIYSIGNMLLLSIGANTKNSNKYLGDKNDINSKMYIICKYGKGLIVNEDFINTYDLTNKWDEEEIYKRTERLTSMIINELLSESDNIECEMNIITTDNNLKIASKEETMQQKIYQADIDYPNLVSSDDYLNVVDWDDEIFTELQKSKPKYVEIEGKKNLVHSWKIVLDTIFNYLYFDKNYRDKLLNIFLDQRPEQGFRCLLVSKISSDSSEKKKYTYIEDGVYLYNYYNTSQLLKCIVKFFKPLHFNKNEIKVYYY